LFKNLKKSFIYLNLLSITLPVLFIKKFGGRFRFYINYYILNIIFIKDYYLFLLVKEILNNLKKIYYFTKINIISIFNNI
ncbi:putative retrotransposon poly protein, partial [Aspergillus ibericus CBS 121593]